MLNVFCRIPQSNNESLLKSHPGIPAPKDVGKEDLDPTLLLERDDSDSVVVKHERFRE